MANLNKVMIIGNLTRDPELRHTPKGSAVAELGIAVNRTWNNEAGQKHEETTFIDVTFWGKQAETIQKYLVKGNPIYIEGRMKLDTWDDKETGKKRSKLGVVGESFQFLSSGERSAQPAQAPSLSRQREARPVTAPAAEEDDIPF